MTVTIVSYEGLAGTLGRWVRRGLLDRTPSTSSRFEYAWTAEPKNFGRTEIIVIGHSFGVRSAVETARRSQNVRLLLLLDPRMPPLGRGGVVSPRGVKTICFYQTGFMRGWPVVGAENHLVSGVRHTAVPRVAVATLEKYLRHPSPE